MKYLYISLLAMSLYSCCESRGITRISYEWDTITVKKPVFIPLPHDSIRIWDLDLINIKDTVISSGRARAEFNPGSSSGKVNVKIDCLPDTVEIPVEVKVPVYLPKEIDCSPDKTALKAKLSQGRTEGAAAVIIGLLLIIILFRFLQGVITTYIPR